MGEREKRALENYISGADSKEEPETAPHEANTQEPIHNWDPSLGTQLPQSNAPVNQYPMNQNPAGTNPAQGNQNPSGQNFSTQNPANQISSSGYPNQSPLVQPDVFLEDPDNFFAQHQTTNQQVSNQLASDRSASTAPTQSGPAQSAPAQSAPDQSPSVDLPNNHGSDRPPSRNLNSGNRRSRLGTMNKDFSGRFADGQSDVTAAGAELNEGLDQGSPQQQGAPLPGALPVPPELRNFVFDYIEVSKRLLTNPQLFFSQLQIDGGMAEPAKFLAFSALGGSVLSALFHGFNILKIPGSFCFEMVACCVVSAAATVLAKGQGSKVNFPAVFRVFAYCSCLAWFAEIPGVSLLVTPVAIYFNFIGLRQVLQINVFQTITVMGLVGLLQVALSVGRFFQH